MMIGCDPLNATRKRFGRGALSAGCPHCPDKLESVDHFLRGCTLYTHHRKELYRIFIKVYPDRERPFNHIGLLKEPETQAGISRQREVIEALNTFITAAMAMRRQRLTQNDDWSHWDDVFGDNDMSMYYDDWDYDAM